VNSQPGVDRTIRVVDIGSENFAIGVIHRGATGARGTTAGGGAAGGGRRCARGARPWPAATCRRWPPCAA
jgi:hypothetical protein